MFEKGSSDHNQLNLVNQSPFGSCVFPEEVTLFGHISLLIRTTYFLGRGTLNKTPSQ